MSRKEKIQIAVTVVLLLLLTVILKVKMRRRSDLSPEAPPVLTEVRGVLRVNDAGLNLGKGEGSSVLRRDPFAEPDRAKKTEGEGPELNGILWSDERPMAVINHQIVGIGMAIDEYTVVAITRRDVILSDGRMTHTLSLQY